MMMAHDLTRSGTIGQGPFSLHSNLHLPTAYKPAVLPLQIAASAYLPVLDRQLIVALPSTAA
jgi:hypothetical protein